MKEEDQKDYLNLLKSLLKINKYSLLKMNQELLMMILMKDLTETNLLRMNQQDTQFKEKFQERVDHQLKHLLTERKMMVLK